jgi:arsenate reductase-like glutaredoxin family protein
MLNDPQLIEAAETLVLLTLNEETLTDEQRLEKIFRKITSRKPDDSELKRLMEYLEETLKEAEGKTKEKMEKKLSTEENNQITSARLHAFTKLTSLIFNLDEATVKG